MDDFGQKQAFDERGVTKTMANRVVVYYDGDDDGY